VDTRAERSGEGGFRFGFVALIGRPNAGKSTLVNTVLGEKVAIVSKRPQTTRNRIVGVCNRPSGQAVLLDLPGVHKPMHTMNVRMMREVYSGIEEADVVLHLIDAAVSWGAGERYLFDLLSGVQQPVIGVLTKIDLVERKRKLLPLMERYRQAVPQARELVPISAVSGDGVDELIDQVLQALPEGPPMYPADLPTTQTERFFVAEVIREKLLEHLSDELPYTTGVVVESFDEAADPLQIHAVIYVERPSQKGVVIGRRGRMLGQIGQQARLELESWLGARLFLGLRVKVHRRWRDDVRVLSGMEPGVVVTGTGQPSLEELRELSRAASKGDSEQGS
jgi:GTP-binding protein Era